MDCNKTIDYLAELERMCDAQEKCEHCPLDDCCSGDALWVKSPKQAIEIVQKWSDEHPPKTYADDFLEKFPKVSKDNNAIPWNLCRKYFYGERLNGCCDRCSDCWNEPMEE